MNFKKKISKEKEERKTMRIMFVQPCELSKGIKRLGQKKM